MCPCVATRRGAWERRLGYKYNYCLFLNTKLCVVWWLVINLWGKKRGVSGSNARSTLFFVDAGCGKGEVVVALDDYIRFLIE
jgi:hypothetical protein